jgi:Zn-finger nucleic acid-binding protein
MIPVCPHCDIGLMILRYKGVEIDFCDQCRGIWLDAGELEQFVTQSDSPLNIKDTGHSSPSKRVCPRCDAAMCEAYLSISPSEELSLDRCPKGHGLWFDDRELQRLLKHQNVTQHSVVMFLDELFGQQPATNQPTKEICP